MFNVLHNSENSKPITIGPKIVSLAGIQDRLEQSGVAMFGRQRTHQLLDLQALAEKSTTEAMSRLELNDSF